jgi:hypothetical protein
MEGRQSRKGSLGPCPLFFSGTSVFIQLRGLATVGTAASHDAVYMVPCSFRRQILDRITE